MMAELTEAQFKALTGGIVGSDDEDWSSDDEVSDLVAPVVNSTTAQPQAVLYAPIKVGTNHPHAHPGCPCSDGHHAVMNGDRALCALGRPGCGGVNAPFEVVSTEKLTGVSVGDFVCASCLKTGVYTDGSVRGKPFQNEVVETKEKGVVVETQEYEGVGVTYTKTSSRGTFYVFMRLYLPRSFDVGHDLVLSWRTESMDDDHWFPAVELSRTDPPRGRYRGYYVVNVGCSLRRMVDGNRQTASLSTLLGVQGSRANVSRQSNEERRLLLKLETSTGPIIFSAAERSQIVTKIRRNPVKFLDHAIWDPVVAQQANADDGDTMESLRQELSEKDVIIRQLQREKLEAQQALRDATQAETVDKARFEKKDREVNELRSVNDALKKTIAHLKYKLTCLPEKENSLKRKAAELRDLKTSLKECNAKLEYAEEQNKRQCVQLDELSRKFAQQDDRNEKMAQLRKRLEDVETQVKLSVENQVNGDPWTSL